MTRDEVLLELKSRCGEYLVEMLDKGPRRAYVEIRPSVLFDAARYLFEDAGARFNTASGVDERTHVEILYHFTVEDLDWVISLRVRLDKAALTVPSLAPYIEAVNWIERELNELLGIEFEGHPDMRRLLLSDQWPEGVYPLRQDYREWDDTAVRDRGV